MTVRVRHKGQVTIPAAIRDAVQLDEGVELAVAIHGGDIVLSRVEARDESDGNGNGNGSSVFSDELQERLERALAEVEAGEMTAVYEDDESFFNSLT